MKKFSALLLAMMLVFACVPAMAETTETTETTAEATEATEPTTVEITFEGAYVEFADYGFQVMLPSEWNVFEDENALIYVGDEEGTQALGIYAYDAAGVDLTTIAESIATELGYTVSPLNINGIDFMLYLSEEDDSMGAFVNTADNTNCIAFVFYPYSNTDLQELSQQILASVQAL